MSKKGIDPWYGAQCCLCARDADGYYPEWTGNAPGQADELTQHLASAHGVATIQRVLVFHLSASNYYRRDDKVIDGDGRHVGNVSYIVPKEE